MESDFATAQAIQPDLTGLLLLAFLGLIVVLVVRNGTDQSKRNPNNHASSVQRNKPQTKAPSGPPKPSNFKPVSHKPWSPEYQMSAIADVDFERRRALNKEEARVLYALEAILEKLESGYRLLIQPSLGELLKPKAHFKSASGKKAYSAINSKRLDFGIIDRFGYLVAAIEYQGSGHYHEKSFMRDAVKREVLRKAGVDLIEIRKGELPSDLERRVLASIYKLAPQPQSKNA